MNPQDEAKNTVLINKNDYAISSSDLEDPINETYKIDISIPIQPAIVVSTDTKDGYVSDISISENFSTDFSEDDSILDPMYSPSKSECLNFEEEINGIIRPYPQPTFHITDILDSNRKSATCESSSNIQIDKIRESATCESSANLQESELDSLNEELQPQASTHIFKKPIETVQKSHYNDKLNYCLYCDKDVTHFTRHILTWHSSEITVQQIISVPANSKERRNIITSLRKKGNFIKNRSADTLRPVKRLNSKSTSEFDDFLPCSHCLGFYKRKSLYRHTKKCHENSNESNGRQAAQSDGQTTLLMGKIVKYDKLLSKALFSRMRADNVNCIAKQDVLICQYAYSYIKGRKSKGNLDFVRQNVRRLAKLLIFCRQQDPHIKKLIDTLKPSKFELILAGVNKIAKYNDETDTYESPTLAMNFGTLLKKCCDLAYIQLIQIENTNDQRKDLKILKKIIESQWADEVSAQAGLNLSEKKWNKNELLPLTSDLKKLGVYLKHAAKEAYNILQINNRDISAYTELKELVYTQIILLNRRRPSEVAQLKVDKYNSINKAINENEESTEFENCLTETEKILLKTYSRIVIRGKRGKGVPILLSSEMKKHFDYFISLRNSFIKDNEYIFHTYGKGFIDGTRIVYKYAIKCGIEKPKTISATKLRKHLATISQLLQFEDKDLEQLSKFMGHTLNTHCNFYRLSDNMYQTAKVSKLLLLMGEGGIEQYKGKTLDEIDINLTPIEEEETILNRMSENPTNDEDDEEENKKDPVSKIAPKRNPIIRSSWNLEQKRVISQFFSDHIKNKQSPKQIEVNDLVFKYPDLFKDKKWTSIKAVVYNLYTGKLKPI